MLVLKKNDLKLGQRFSSPLFFDDQKSMFLPAEYPVSQMALNVFDDWPVESVCCDGFLLPFDDDIADFSDLPIEEAECCSDEADGCEFIGEAVCSNAEPEKREDVAPFCDEKISRSCERQFERMKDVLSKFASKSYAKIRGEVLSIASDIFSMTKSARNLVLGSILCGANGIGDFHRRAVNTAILTCAISQTLSVPAAKTMEYMQGALLHDIEMQQFVPDISSKNGVLSNDQFSKIKMHTLQAYHVLVNEAEFPEEIAEIALCHHERFDGGGYPRGLTKEQISEGTAIVTVADSFEALVSSRPSRSSLMGAAAMKRIMANSGKKFNPRIVEAFVRTVGIFPIGSCVLLSTQEKARVIAANYKTPMRPSVCCGGKEIDLSKEKGIYIVRALDDDEVRGLAN